MLLPFIFLDISLLFLIGQAKVFSRARCTRVDIPCNRRVQMVLRSNDVMRLGSSSHLECPGRFKLFGHAIRL